jgi:hypothetical protein
MPHSTTPTSLKDALLIILIYFPFSYTVRLRRARDGRRLSLFGVGVTEERYTRPNS